MNHPLPASIPLDAIVSTDELSRRVSRAPDWCRESCALGELAQAMSESPETVLQKLAEVALDLCRADSAGVSIEEGEVFRWRATAGAYAAYNGGTMPRDFSPCGIVMDRNALQLMSAPIRYFPYIADLSPPVEEVLLVPFYQNEIPIGTVWVVAHTTERHFDSEDARLAGSLARFAGAAVQTLDRIKQSKQAEESQRNLACQLEQQSRVFNTTLSSLSDFAYTFDCAGRFVYSNDALLRLLGLSLEEIKGKTFFELPYPADLAEQLHRQIQQVIETGEKLVDETPYLSPTGVAGYYEYIFSPVIGDSGTIEFVVGSTRDITERRRVQEELRKTQQRLEATLAAGEVATWMWDIKNDRVTADRNLAHLFGVSAEDAANGPIAAYLTSIHPDDRTAVSESIGQALKVHTPFEATYRVRNAAGEYRTVIARGRPEYDAEDQPIGLPGVIVDITQLRELQEERSQLVASLQEADRKKDDFIALLAHELRNPLAPIRNGLQVLRLAGDDQAVATESREMMERQLTHMVRLIDDLLDISRISRNKMELRRARVSLEDVLNSAIETASPVIEESRHELTKSLGLCPIYLDADLTRLAQVFSNLLTNAAKYTPAGGKISITVKQIGGRIAVSVQDTGIGIPAESLKDIFNMFSQVDRSVERATGGLGIGLALVKGLVEMHGGNVEATSAGEGKGSTVTVSLPVAPPETVVDTLASHLEKRLGPKQRVLVVDDNRDGAQSLAMLLRLSGNEVRTAFDGEQAAAEAEQFRPDLILMDVGMPRLNGYEATKRIRDEPWGNHIRIIALTGWGQEDDKERSREAGCDGHLVKPVGLTDLEQIARATAL
jgi:PAS domain S-box-containing protein